jgi:hypothetical protein
MTLVGFTKTGLGVLLHALRLQGPVTERPKQPWQSAAGDRLVVPPRRPRSIVGRIQLLKHIVGGDDRRGAVVQDVAHIAQETQHARGACVNCAKNRATRGSKCDRCSDKKVRYCRGWRLVMALGRD